MGVEDYRPRIIDEQLEHVLSLVGAVVIKGPKWSGKTTSARRISKSEIDLQDPDYSERYRSLAEYKISALLEGANPRLIDEWQLIPEIWNAVRFSVDRRMEHGLYVL